MDRQNIRELFWVGHETNKDLPDVNFVGIRKADGVLFVNTEQYPTVGIVGEHKRDDRGRLMRIAFCEVSNEVFLKIARTWMNKDKQVNTGLLYAETFIGHSLKLARGVVIFHRLPE